MKNALLEKLCLLLPSLASSRCAESESIAWRRRQCWKMHHKGLPAVLIGARLRQSISKCPLSGKKQREIRKPAACWSRPRKVAVYTHNPLSGNSFIWGALACKWRHFTKSIWRRKFILGEGITFPESINETGSHNWLPRLSIYPYIYPSIIKKENRCWCKYNTKIWYYYILFWVTWWHSGSCCRLTERGSWLSLQFACSACVHMASLLWAWLK